MRHSALGRAKTALDRKVPLFHYVIAICGSAEDAARNGRTRDGHAVADKLQAQGEIVLGGDVRYFAMHLPPVLTDRERPTESIHAGRKG